MWDYSSIEDNWKKRDGKLDKRFFNYLRQEIEDVRYYSKCLDGTSYVYSQDLNDIYDVSKYRDSYTYKIDSSYSSYFNGTVTTEGDDLSISVGGNSEAGFYNRYKSEYGFTLKNLFSPKRLFDYTNFLSVDVATTDPIDFNRIDPNLPFIIDGVTMVEGQRLLVKDNVSTVTLNGTVDPDTFFLGNYYEEDTVGNQITYRYFNNENGIYLYTNKTLVRENDLATYSTNIEYSVNVKLGDTHQGKNYHLSRLLKGHFPLTSNNEPIEFTEKVDYVVRNSLEYRNVLDNNFYSSIAQTEEFVTANDDTFRIPDRMIAVGDFGMIINYQSEYSNIIDNKFKENLNDIVSFKDKYLIVGNNGNLLSMDKVSMDIDITPLETFENFLSIDVSSNDRGIITGENGIVLTSLDSKKWDVLETDTNTNINEVKFFNLRRANFVGNNGLYGRIRLDNNREFRYVERELNIKPNLFDERRVRNDLYNINNINVENQYFKLIGDDWVDINKDINSSFSFDFTFKPTGLTGSDDQVLFTFTPIEESGVTAPIYKGIKVVIRFENDEYRLKTIITDNLENTVILDGDVILSNDKWYHMFLTRYKNEYSLFINKRLSDSTDIGFDSNFNNFNNRIRLGAELTYDFDNSQYLTASYNHFVGIIDNVRLWQTNLNNREVFDYSNNYTEDLPDLNTWYKFNIIKVNGVKRILTKDLIDNRNLILPSFSNLLAYNLNTSLETMVEIESFKGVSIIGDGIIAFVLNDPGVDYSDEDLNTNFYIEFEDSTKNLLYNSADKFYYGTSDERTFRIDSFKLELNLFNDINKIEPEIETILEKGFDELSMNNVLQELYLISGPDNEIEKIDLTNICIIEELDPLENCPIYITVSTINTTNSIDIENEYKEDVVDNDNTNSINYIKTLGYPSSTQSVLEIPLEKDGLDLDLYKELYLGVTIEDQINGYFEVSLNDRDYTKLEGNGDYLVPLAVGSDSRLRVRAVLAENTNNNKIKGFLKNLTIYEAECIQEIRPRTYDNSFNIRKIYFSQFDFEDELTKFDNEFLYSYIDLKSLKIDDAEQISLGTYQSEGFPKYLYNFDYETFAVSNCDGNYLCDFSNFLSNDTLDRVRYGFGLSVDGTEEAYIYDGTSYGLLEAFTINNVQTLGVDRSDLSNGVSTLDNPYYIGIDFRKDLYMEVDSFIINSDDLINQDITNGATTSQNVIVTSTVSYGTVSGNYFNQMTFTGSYITYSVDTTSTLQENKIYQIEMELDGDISILFGTISVTFSGSNEIVNKQVRVNENLTSFDIAPTTTSLINNLVVTDRLPTKSVVLWDKDTCNLVYKLNGTEQQNNGLLLESGDIYAPSCDFVQNCDNQSQGIVNFEFWDSYNSKLLFLDYDIASKLYFFDIETGDYQLPQTVELSDINQLTIRSVDNEKSWVDYSRDATKDFVYLAAKTEANSVKYNNTFRNSEFVTSFDIILNGNSTNDINDINGATQGLLPNLGATLSLGIYNTQKDVYFFNKYLIFVKPATLDVELGDIINFKNSLIDANLMVIFTYDVGGDTLVYLRSDFDDNLTKRLISWTKTTTFSNLNLFRNNTQLTTNFNLHPISVGYTLEETDLGTININAKYNPKTAYYNMECNAFVQSNLFVGTSNIMRYPSKIGSFGFSPKYNILSYLSEDSRFDSNYKILSLPEYRFSNSNSGVVYTLTTGYLSFNKELKNEWESIPEYTFLDLTFDDVTLESVLVLDKMYDEESERYIIKTYDYYNSVYQASDLNSLQIDVRVRNTLNEISKDLQKINNIQQSSSPSYQITDLSTSQFTSYISEKSNLNFKPNTDSYAKALLSQKEIKDFLSGIVYTDANNYLAVNIINLDKEDVKTIVGVGKYYVECDDCVFEDYLSFTNPNNGNDYNQFAVFGLNNTYTNRVPVSLYGYNNQIQVVGATGASNSVDIPISFATQSGNPTKTLEFIVRELESGIIEVAKASGTISTIGTLPNDRTKIQFTDDGLDDLIIRVLYSEDNRITLDDIRVGNGECIDDCFLTSLVIKDHGLSVGDGIAIQIEDDISQLTNLYESEFETAAQTDWVLNDQGSTSSVPLLTGAITDLLIQGTSSLYYEYAIGVTEGNAYRLSFDYTIKGLTGGTPSFNPAFGPSASLTLQTEFDELTSANSVRVESNFIATTASIYFGFNMPGTAEFFLTLNNIEVNELTNRSKYYDGYNVVTEVVDEDTVVIPTDYIGTIEELSMTYSYTNPCGITTIREKTISDVGTSSISTFDPYLNYEPIDLFKLGNDNDINKSIEIKRENWVNNNEVVSLVDLDMAKYRFRLIDRLTVRELIDKYPWVLESEIRDAIIGKDEDGIVWYKGIWDCGRWFDGKWYSGTWRDGVWYSGTWFNSEIRDNGNTVDIRVLDSTKEQSIWKDGTWFDGIKKGGVWENGTWFDGTWEKGDWFDGTWNMGLWEQGEFKRGTWISGTWNTGTFNCDLGMSMWVDGTWLSGDFECGRWFTGRFDSKLGPSTFGKGASLSRKAIWENGFFVTGEFNSGDNSRNDLSVWNTGTWNTGTWNGGTSYQINFNNGTWNEGVVKDIPIVAFSGNTNGINFFTLLGDWKFETNDTFWVIDNDTNNSIYGSDVVPNKYRVDIDSFTVENGKYTKVFVNNLPNALRIAINTDGSYNEGYENNDTPTDNTITDTPITKIVSNISKVEWYNGRLENGIFDGRFLRNGLWYEGSFKSGEFGF